MSKDYDWTQEDRTPEIDALSNELGILNAQKEELDRHFEHCAGYSWDLCDPAIKEYREIETEIKRIKAHFERK